jgi:hypothetical protein
MRSVISAFVGERYFIQRCEPLIIASWTMLIRFVCMTLERSLRPRSATEVRSYAFIIETKKMKILDVTITSSRARCFTGNGILRVSANSRKKLTRDRQRVDDLRANARMAREAEFTVEKRDVERGIIRNEYRVVHHLKQAFCELMELRGVGDHCRRNPVDRVRSCRDGPAGINQTAERVDHRPAADFDRSNLTHPVACIGGEPCRLNIDNQEIRLIDVSTLPISHNNPVMACDN